MRNEVMEIDPHEDVVAEDIRALAEPYGFKPGAAIVNRLHHIAQQKQLGHFGLVKDILNESYATARAAKRALNDEVVIKIAERVMSELKQRKDLYE
jgi:hypothetical protein